MLGDGVAARTAGRGGEALSLRAGPWARVSEPPVASADAGLSWTTWARVSGPAGSQRPGRRPGRPEPPPVGRQEPRLPTVVGHSLTEIPWALRVVSEVSWALEKMSATLALPRVTLPPTSAMALVTLGHVGA